MILSLLVAADEANVIGKDNQLPWHLPNDLKYFKNLTWGAPILMGRKTFDSIGKPLPGRYSIVITRNQEWRHDGVEVVHSVEDAIEAAQRHHVNELFLIGGAEIFNSALPQANRIYLTRIHHRFDGDTWFPELPATEWALVKETPAPADDKNPWPHTFQVWERVREGAA
ncbi:dihydrofolate reductase [Flaviaesturariibacter amylovorans]|uniref:Dihydrofolate reductase n=1 Tax=Flaviaesturariibacter amylovorans TaxID=1084520 RepID=A0ABP8GMQ8_9BACT